MLNIETLSGVYSNARAISNLLGDGTNIEARVKRVLDSNGDRTDLIQALANLESHLRVMGFSELIAKQE